MEAVKVIVEETNRAGKVISDGGTSFIDIFKSG